MSTREQTQARFAQLRPFLPYLAALLAVLAVWLAWSGWRQLQDGTRRTNVMLARDTAANVASSLLGGERKRLQDRLGTAPVQAALQAGDLDAAGKALAADWPSLEAARVLPPDLGTVYAGLPAAGLVTLRWKATTGFLPSNLDWSTYELIHAPPRLEGRANGSTTIRASSEPSALKAS